MIKIDISGIAEAKASYLKLSRLVTQRAVKDAIAPELPAMKAYMKDAAPEDTGALKQSITSIIKTYPSRGFVFAAIGPRRGVFKGRRPSRYAHIVELLQTPFIRSTQEHFAPGFGEKVLSRFVRSLS